MIRTAFCVAVLMGVTGSVVLAGPDLARPNRVAFAPADVRFVRLVILASDGTPPCIDELEVYAAEGDRNLALASAGAKATASSSLAGYAIHQIAHLNDGLYGNSHSWIAAGAGEEWAQIELPRPARIAKVVFSRDREGKFKDRMPVSFEVRLSLDGKTWRTVAQVDGRPVTTIAKPLPVAGPIPEEDLLRYAFACEERSWHKAGDTDSIGRTLVQMESLLDRLQRKGLDVARERKDLAELQRRHQAWRKSGGDDRQVESEIFWAARLAKRSLLLRDPDLSVLEKILFVKRHPFVPSHNYSDLLDAEGLGGGGVYVLEIPRRAGRLNVASRRLTELFAARAGVARDAVADFAARSIYFAWKASKDNYYHLMSMQSDGSAPHPLTDGPFHDFYPCPLPDGGLAFMSTRCKGRFLCWRPQAYTLFRMDAGSANMRVLSYANLSEWAPTVMRDGRILWTRSEYQDKGADFGHTLWAIRPDGTHPELIFGNNTRFCYVGAREVPGTAEICATLMSHGGDLNGPIALIDAARSRFDPAVVASITPDSPPQFHMSWSSRACFRDPSPISRDYILCTHAPDDRFGLYVIDRWGNREILYLDPAIGSMCPTPLRPSPRPPVLSSIDRSSDEASETGIFYVADVYRGLEPTVKRGAVKYIRVCQEVKSELLRLPSGEYQKDHEPFMDWYATPTHVVSGPNGWPTYVAKADLGTAPVEADGSASFHAPAGKVLYFQVLDKDYNELQRMRSVIQLQPGERRGCIGCHESRASAPAIAAHPLALRRQPSQLQPPPWGAGPFSYEKVVQPVWDAKCVRCHSAGDARKIDLSGRLDREKVPASYRTLVEQGWVHYFDCQWGQEHTKAAPATFGTLKSRLWPLLDAGHYETRLTPEEMQRVKCWIDLNCPLWPDYVLRSTRPGPVLPNP